MGTKGRHGTTACCLVLTGYCLPRAACGVLPGACCLLPAARCLLLAACYSLCAACCGYNSASHPGTCDPWLHTLSNHLRWHAPFQSYPACRSVASKGLAAGVCCVAMRCGRFATPRHVFPMQEVIWSGTGVSAECRMTIPSRADAFFYYECSRGVPCGLYAGLRPPFSLNQQSNPLLLDSAEQ